VIRRLGAWALRVTLGLAAAAMAAVLLFRWVDPPVTPLMLLRAAGGAPIDRRWVPLDAISPALIRSVIAAEDAGFFEHRGVDWRALRRARAFNARQRGGRRRGGSTITMQCARNVFLWPGRSYVRKGLEIVFAVLIEGWWGKRRILEVYLNVAEWGDGIYGAEAAAQHWFRVPAAQLGAGQAARLAAVLPSPLRWNPVAPGPWVARRAAIIARRAGSVRLPPAWQTASAMSAMHVGLTRWRSWGRPC